MFQYDKEAPLKTMARDLCKVVGGNVNEICPDWTFSESGECWECPTNSLWPANTVVSSGSVHWSEGEL